MQAGQEVSQLAERLNRNRRFPHGKRSAVWTAHPSWKRTVGPIREFTDDYIRNKLAAMTPEEAWKAVMPLSKVGRILGDLNVDIDIAEPIPKLNRALVAAGAADERLPPTIAPTIASGIKSTKVSMM